MKINSEFLYRQMKRFSPILDKMSVESQRQSQDRLGSMLSVSYRRRVKITSHPLPHCQGVWVTPLNLSELRRKDSTILYLHGGGYVTGGAPYVSGVAAKLCQRLALPVLAPVYRLAPENPFPAALHDALAAWDSLLAMGYAPDRILLCGESAGGGLCLALSLLLKEAGRPLPAGQILLSPWVDLTQSGKSITKNASVDPSLSRKRLELFVHSYCQEDSALPSSPLCSPLFGDFTGLPPTLTIAGGYEILLSDARRLTARLRAAGVPATLRITPKLWHAYTLYPIPEAEKDFQRMDAFWEELSAEWSKL
ncbi:MAG: alpha/beta hydrolase [Clostridia bacterium]|nr:alpha/beta hydrolase [Clostridia bacterium]